jgi:hypothetical protein
MTKKNLVNRIVAKNADKPRISPNQSANSKSSSSSGLSNFGRQLEEEIARNTALNKNFNTVKRAFKSSANAREFWTNYKLKGKVYPQNFNTMIKNFEARKLREAFSRVGGELL